MPDLDALLRKYKDRTSCNPPDAIESQVLTQIQATEAAAFLPLIIQPAFRPAAMFTGLVIGIIIAGTMPALRPTHSTADLGVFAADSPYLASAWLNPNPKQ